MKILKKVAPNAPAFSVRGPAEASPEFAERKLAVRRLDEQYSALDAEDADLRHRLNNQNPSESKMNSRVAALLGDDVDEADPAVDGVLARLRAIAQERIDVRAARDIARERLAASRFAVSRTICNEVEPEYRARVATLADALVAVHSAHAAVVELLDALDAGDVARPVLFDHGRATAMLGAPADPNGRLAAWFRETAAAGLIDKNAIPAELAR